MPISEIYLLWGEKSGFSSPVPKSIKTAQKTAPNIIDFIKKNFRQNTLFIFTISKYERCFIRLWQW
jgi:hypothetical protein